ncbi:KHG/KDPG aldolase [Diplonema papillatum]|nr:KHG/KDPG aldolase [Diplonema papillatum]
MAAARVVCFGEILVHVKAFVKRKPNADVEDDMSDCHMAYAGFEFNVARGLGSLGRQVSFVSVLPTSGMADSALRIAVSSGLDTANVIMDQAADAEMGSIFTMKKETIYQIRHSSFCRRVDGRSFDWSPIFKGASAFVCSAQSAAVSGSVRSAWSHAIRKAAAHKVPIALDLSFSPSVVDVESIWEVAKRVLPSVTVLFIPESSLGEFAEIAKAKLPDARKGTAEWKLEALKELRATLRVPLLATSIQRPLYGLAGWQFRWSAVACSSGVVSTKKTAVQHKPMETLFSEHAWVAGFIDSALEQNWFGAVSGHAALDRRQLHAAARKGDVLAALSQETATPNFSFSRSRLSEIQLDGESTTVVGTAADISTRRELETALRECRVIPLLKLNRPQEAAEAMRTFIAAGVRVVEVQMCSDTGEECLREVLKATEGTPCLVGVGRVHTVPVMRRAVRAGAAFVTSPGVNLDILSAAAHAGIPYVPGISTPTDLLLCLKHNLKDVIFFPADQPGAESLLKRLAEAYPSFRFTPSGNIPPSMALRYASHPQVLGVSSTWVADSDIISEQRWCDLQERIRQISSACPQLTNTILGTSKL